MPKISIDAAYEQLNVLWKQWAEFSSRILFLDGTIKASALNEIDYKQCIEGCISLMHDDLTELSKLVDSLPTGNEVMAIVKNVDFNLGGFAGQEAVIALGWHSTSMICAIDIGKDQAVVVLERALAMSNKLRPATSMTA